MKGAGAEISAACPALHSWPAEWAGGNSDGNSRDEAQDGSDELRLHGFPEYLRILVCPGPICKNHLHSISLSEGSRCD